MKIKTTMLGAVTTATIALGGAVMVAPAAHATTSPHTAVAAKSSSSCTNLRTIRQGSTGYEVAKLQHFLNELRGLSNFSEWNQYPKLATDGVFGKATKNATRSIQDAYSLTSDGVVGPKTWYAFTNDTCNINKM